ncbi:MAG: redoxin domain-containing protein [Clostridia bacterium]|nr:redoxin domain-containing protein [Clostridia bacterium]MBQ3938172.1 redoxin domain-containing protein [Clostridia bacterium]MBQ5487724.1 redoxin domain-containing protein [Clostridia bacterium]
MKMQNTRPVRSRFRAGFTAIILAAAMLLTVFSPIAASVFDEAGAKNAVGQDISAFSTTDIHGNAVNGSVLSDANLIVIHYFALWSPDCVREMDYMQDAMEEFESSGLLVLGLLHEDSASTPEACAAFMEENDYTYTVLRQDSVLSAMVSEYPMIPQTFIVYPNGIVADHFPGSFESYSQLEELISSLIGSFIPNHTVRFYDGLTYRLILRVSVPHGHDAEPPEPPYHPGYVFAGWVGDYHNVTENRDIKGVYTIDPDYYQPGDVDMDGRLTISDAVMVMRYTMGIYYSDGVLMFGDADGNGTIDVADALLIMRAALGLSGV